MIEFSVRKKYFLSTIKDENEKFLYLIRKKYFEVCDQLVKGQWGLMKKITVKDASVNS